MINNSKINFSGSQTKQKIQLPADDPLVDILKSQYYDLVVTANIDGSVILSLPNDRAFESKILDSIVGVFQEEPEFVRLPFPELTDIKLSKIETSIDANGSEKLKFVFNVKNNAGAAVVGVEGVGG